jgi:hypothetical protein
MTSSVNSSAALIRVVFAQSVFFVQALGTKPP